MGDELAMIIDDAVKEAAFILNCMIKFADIPKGDSHKRRFFVYGKSIRDVRNPEIKTKYGIGILYIIDGIIYEVKKPLMIELTVATARVYVDRFMGLVNDLSNAYSSVDIWQFDMEFMQMVGSGKVSKVTDKKIIAMLNRRRSK